MPTQTESMAMFFELPGKTECIRGVKCDYSCVFFVILQMDVQGSVIDFLITWHG